MLSLLSLLAGAGVRLLPELLSLWNKKTDNAHELAMMSRQFELESLRAKQAAEAQLALATQIGADKLAQLQVQAEREKEHDESTELLATLAAMKEAQTAQMQRTGIRIVDILNFSVRPVTTYYMLALYGLAKIAMFMVAYNSGLNTWATIVSLYGEEDRNILSGILGFWFLNRTLTQRNK